MTPDLDLKAAREAVAQRFAYLAEIRPQGSPIRRRYATMALEFRAGSLDHLEEVTTALSAIRIRREMEAANG